MAITSVDSAASSTVLLAVDTARRGLIVTNTDANALYVLLDGGTASTTNYSFSLATGESATVPDYPGPLTGIWAGNGSGVALLSHW